MTNEQFWLVWNLGGNSPTCPHQTRQSAQQEAERLAMANPHHEFYVVKALSRVKATAAISTELQPPKKAGWEPF